MSMPGSPAPSSHYPSSGGRTSDSSSHSRAIPLNLDHHEVRRSEAKANGSRLHSKQAGCSRVAPAGSPPGTLHFPTFVHFPDFASSVACHIQELEMLDVLGAGPYVIFGRPLVLQIMPDFFYFQFTELTTIPIWVRFPNLPLRCWSHICLSKIESMVGKPIHCDGPTAQMTRVSYARVLIEVDLLSDLPSTVIVHYLMVTLWCSNWYMNHCHAIVSSVSLLAIPLLLAPKVTSPAIKKGPMTIQPTQLALVLLQRLLLLRNRIRLWGISYLLYSFIPVWSLLWQLMGISPAWLRICTRLSTGWLLLAGLPTALVVEASCYCLGGSVSFVLVSLERKFPLVHGRIACSGELVGLNLDVDCCFVVAGLLLVQLFLHHRSPPSPTIISSSGIGTSTIREADGSPVANSSPPLHGFIVEDYSDDEELEEKHGRWRDRFSSNRSISSRPKLLHFSAFNDIQSCPLLTEDLDHSCDDWKLYAIGYDSGKFPSYYALNSITGNIWKGEATLTIHELGCSSIDDSLIDAPLADAPLIEVSLTNAPKLDASIVLIKPCVAQDEQHCT
ncbi:hypothetical protein NC652_034961 [Populus alba x Populus x berolinensis]|nr:hypothetical protein NC652_034961 [Populus alba x Populus x berolinensis]